jgi:hypothetical protein
VTIVSQPDRLVAIDFAPPGPTGHPHLRLVSVAVAVLVIGVLVVGVTQLLLH